jgi:hypothetical protein
LNIGDSRADERAVQGVGPAVMDDRELLSAVTVEVGGSKEGDGDPAVSSISSVVARAYATRTGSSVVSAVCR